MLRLSGSLLSIMAVTALGAWSQPLQSDRPPFTISAKVDYVLLDVGVTDKHGTFVKGLNRSDFQVFENAHPRPITYFADADSPASIGLVVDNSGSMLRKRPEVIAAGLAFISESNPTDEFFVAHFNDGVRLGLPGSIRFSNDPALLRQALYLDRAQGQTALYDAIAFSLRHLQHSARTRHTLVVVSDGRDNVSRMSLPELEHVLAASQATVYTIGLFDPDQSDRNPGVLRKIARLTGGFYFEPKSESELMPLFHGIARDIRQRYSIGYSPDELHDKTTVRRVKVIARQNGGRPRLVAYTRSSYSVIPPAGTSQ